MNVLSDYFKSENSQALAKKFLSYHNMIKLFNCI